MAATAALTPEELAKHVTIWNRIERRKIAGNAAPLRRNLAKYLQKHPECEEYTGQDKDPNLAQAGAIDPVTGERIAVQNEHVPIWHRVERRKVTGNAAPLRKNLEPYLKKNPSCEVYVGQDKMPKSQTPWAQQQHHQQQQQQHLSNPISHTNPHLNNAHPLHSGGIPAVPNQMHHHTHQPVRRWVYAPGKCPAWGQLAQSHQPPPPQNHTGPNQNPVPSLDFAELSYGEMVSSWSNNPEWVNQGADIPLTPTTMNGLNGLLPHSFSSQPGMSPMDTNDSNINGIPIPGGIARDRHDICMATSFGTGTTPLDYSSFLGVTPRSVDADPDPMQFSPSNYLLGSFSGASPPSTLRMHQHPPNPPPISGSEK